MSQESLLLKAIDIHKTYQSGKLKTRALRGIDLEIYKGDYRLILGPSGCGKTTLLNVLGGITTATSGKILVPPPQHSKKNLWKHISKNGNPIQLRDIATFSKKELTDYRRFEVGIIFQFYNLIPILTALENVELTARLAGIKHPRKNAEEILKVVSLEEKMNQFPSKLSGGEQQRVAIARVLVKKPILILADEPTGNLDSTNSRAIFELLLKISKEYKTAILIVTHDNTIAESYGSNHIHIIDGQLEED